MWHHTWYHTYMVKTTLYLPDELKRDVARMAAESGRSEADIIREAIAALVGKQRRPRPRGGLFAGGDASLAEQTEQALTGFGAQ
jgi:Ribbon-helix-helix protein, copG family